VQIAKLFDQLPLDFILVAITHGVFCARLDAVDAEINAPQPSAPVLRQQDCGSVQIMIPVESTHGLFAASSSPGGHLDWR
jgi:hypothetical protein